MGAEFGDALRVAGASFADADGNLFVLASHGFYDALERFVGIEEDGDRAFID